MHGGHDDDTFPIGPNLLELQWEVPPDRLDQFNGWYEEEHLSDMAGVPGILSARRWERDPSYPFAHPSARAHLTLYEVAGLSSFTTPEYERLSKEPSPRTMETASGLGMWRRVYRQLYPPRGVLTAKGPSDSPRQLAGSAVLYVRMWCEPALDEEFNRWYNEEHLPLITGVDGVLHGRRFVDVERARPDPEEGDPEVHFPYVAVYELADAGVAGGQPMREAGQPSPWRQRLGDRVRAHVQVFREVSRLEGTPPASP